MKSLPLLFLGIFFMLAFSFTGIVLTSHVQFGSLEQTTETLEADDNGNFVLVEGEPLYPLLEGGLALQGKEVYIQMGCVYCHSQQTRRQNFGADVDRGWGVRATVPRDYISQSRVLLGTMRTGPDLVNVGGRLQGDGGREWHHKHLYNPQITSKGSNMAPFSFLYNVQPIEGEGSKDAVAIPSDSPYAPPAGFEVVPTRKAKALVEYLLSLKINYSLPEAPILD